MDNSLKQPIVIINPIFDEEIGLGNGNRKNSFNSGNANDSYRNNININPDNFSNNSYRRTVNLSDKISLGFVE